MNKIGKILLGIILLVASFGLSAFGMYEYNNYKAFNNLASQGKQFMIQKDYDKAIQVFQQALSYKNDTEIEKNLALAQNLKSENSKKGIISKNIQLASEAAKNNKYDEANKYLDEILKLEPDNIEAKNLKDTFTKTIKDQQESQQQEKSKNIKQENEVKPIKQNGLKYNEALAILQKKYPGCSFKLADEVIGRGELKKFVPIDIINSSYIFYGHNNIYHDELQGLTVVNKETGKLYWFIDGELKEN